MSEDHYFSAKPASADERREITVTLAGGEYALETASGVFSPGHIDLGTTVLLRTVPVPPPAEFLDLGCGWGPIALTAALRQPDARVTAIDVNERALELLERNVQRIASRTTLAPIAALSPHQVPADAMFDTIWSNPPIRIGKAALHDLLATWLPRLRAGGEAYMVVQRNLGADSLLTWLQAQGWGRVEKVASAKGFRVLRLIRGDDA